MTEILGSAAGQPGGLRERKKARTRAAIREHALRLFREQGWPSAPGANPDDLAVRAVSGAIFGVILAVTTPWEDWSSQHINADLFARMEAGLAHLENGLRR